MLRYFVIIIFSLFVIQGVDAQEFLSTSKNKVDKNGLRQGHWRVFDANGNLKFGGDFNDDIPYGEFKYYYPNGRIMAEGKYLNRKKDSVWKYYSKYDGILLSKEIYKNNLKTGVWETYFPDGDVNEEITYKNDKKNGPWKQYFDNGQIKLKAEYVKDNLEGLMIVYFPDGVVNISGIYKKNMKHGKWMYFNEKAENVKKEVFKNGFLIPETNQ